MAEIVVQNEKDAFELIKRVLQKQVGDDVVLRFDKWPAVEVVLKGQGYESTITPSLMHGLIELQTGINRTYAQLIYGQPDGRTLKDADREALEFKAKVKEGSSVVSVDLSGFAQKLVTDLIGKMEPSQIVLLAVTGAALWAATTMYKHYVNGEVKKKESAVEADKLVALSAQETERVSLITKALAAEPKLALVERNAASTSLALLKGVADAQSIDLNGIPLSNADAHRVVASTRSDSIELQINGNYRILNVDTGKDDEIKIKVRYVDDGREFWAKFRDDSLDKEHLKAMQQAEWGRTLVYLSVNATERHGQVTTATIVSATQQPLKG